MRHRPHYTRSHKPLHGFTMVEIIVALAILSTSMLAVFGVLRMCGAANGGSQRRTESVLLAERLLAQTAFNDAITYQTLEGTEGRFSWRIQTAPTNRDNLAAVSIQIQWSEQQKSQLYRLHSLIHISPRMQGQ